MADYAAGAVVLRGAGRNRLVGLRLANLSPHAVSSTAVTTTRYATSWQRMSAEARRSKCSAADGKSSMVWLVTQVENGAGISFGGAAANNNRHLPDRAKLPYNGISIGTQTEHHVFQALAVNTSTREWTSDDTSTAGTVAEIVVAHNGEGAIVNQAPTRCTSPATFWWATTAWARDDWRRLRYHPADPGVRGRLRLETANMVLGVDLSQHGRQSGQ